MKRLLILIILVAGCATKHKPSTPETVDTLDRLREKRDGWLKDLAAKADKNTGWLSLKDCDGTLWTGEAVAAGHPGQLSLAEWPAGMVHRRPEASGECYPKESASTVSNDMLMGYVLGMYETKDLDALTRLLTYGERHVWTMGEPTTEPRVHYSPEGQGLLARAIAALGGSKSDYAVIPEACLPVEADYEYHLQTLAVYLDGKINSGLSEVCFARAKANAEKFPTDALVQAVYGVYSGKFSDTVALLLSDDYTCPPYVRPAATYCTVHKAMAAKVILDRYEAK